MAAQTRVSRFRQSCVLPIAVRGEDFRLYLLTRFIRISELQWCVSYFFIGYFVVCLWLSLDSLGVIVELKSLYACYTAIKVMRLPRPYASKSHREQKVKNYTPTPEVLSVSKYRGWRNLAYARFFSIGAVWVLYPRSQSRWSVVWSMSFGSKSIRRQ